MTLRQVGANGGQAAAFTYDLARSVVYTRQGNPAWAGQERDGIAADPLRRHVLRRAGDRDWVDLDKVAIPQADEQQRLLANLILQMSADRKPLPRFWYFPRGLKAAVVMTGDDHGNGGTAARFDQLHRARARRAARSTTGSASAARRTSIRTRRSADAEAASFDALGLRDRRCTSTPAAPNYTATRRSAAIYASAARRSSRAKYTERCPRRRRTARTASRGATGRRQASVALANGIRLDTNYYYWPGGWVHNRPGMFTGSGMPMRFAGIDGTMIDVYQAATQMTDESGQTYPFTLEHAARSRARRRAATTARSRRTCTPTTDTSAGLRRDRGLGARPAACRSSRRGRC